MPCKYCEGGTNDDGDANHIACIDEMNRRADVGTCTRCGEREHVGIGLWCAECKSVDNPQYVGYPPGAAQ